MSLLHWRRENDICCPESLVTSLPMKHISVVHSLSLECETGSGKLAKNAKSKQELAKSKQAFANFCCAYLCSNPFQGHAAPIWPWESQELLNTSKAEKRTYDAHHAAEAKATLQCTCFHLPKWRCLVPCMRHDYDKVPVRVTRVAIPLL